MTKPLLRLLQFVLGTALVVVVVLSLLTKLVIPFSTALAKLLIGALSGNWKAIVLVLAIAFVIRLVLVQMGVVGKDDSK